ncbi:MAG: hypothetical protein ABIL58_18715 [Pseudomonadota bacterium]
MLSFGMPYSRSVYHLHPISPTVAELSARLFGDAHKDPADRIIAATAIISQASLVTADGFNTAQKPASAFSIIHRL